MDSSIKKHFILNSPCNIWVCSVINVEHQGICTFDEDRCIAALGGVNERDGIDDIWSEGCTIFLERK